jgi:hypothetical protein
VDGNKVSISKSRLSLDVVCDVQKLGGCASQGKLDRKDDLNRFDYVQYIFWVNLFWNNHKMLRPTECNVGRPVWHQAQKAQVRSLGDGSCFFPFVLYFCLWFPLWGLTGLWVEYVTQLGCTGSKWFFFALVKATCRVVFWSWGSSGTRLESDS